MATFDEAASAAADEASVPSLYCTFAPGGRTREAFRERRTAVRPDLRRTAARDHAEIRVRTDDGDGGKARGVERQRPVVFQQHGSLLFRFLRHGIARGDVYGMN